MFFVHLRFCEWKTPNFKYKTYYFFFDRIVGTIQAEKCTHTPTLIKYNMNVHYGAFIYTSLVSKMFVVSLHSPKRDEKQIMPQEPAARGKKCYPLRARMTF